MIKFVLYILVIPLVIYAMDSINMNSIFKKNIQKKYNICKYFHK